MKILWKAPSEAINGCSEISFSYQGGRAEILLQYRKEGREKKCAFAFGHVLYFRHIGGYFAGAEEASSAYEQLIEAECSPLLTALKERNGEEFALFECRHFSLYTQDDRLFDVVAERVEIKEE